MCLIKKGKFRFNKYGYKCVFIVDNKYRALCTEYKHEPGKWRTADKGGDGWGYYIYNRLKDAKNTKFIFDAILRVAYRKVRKTGYHRGAEVIVAEKMKIIKEVSRKVQGKI